MFGLGGVFGLTSQMEHSPLNTTLVGVNCLSIGVSPSDPSPKEPKNSTSVKVNSVLIQNIIINPILTLKSAGYFGC